MTYSRQLLHAVLRQILLPIVHWSVRLGVGYGEFSRMIKPLFYEAALREMQRVEGKHTDSQLVLASGLHRGDVVFFRRTKSMEQDTEVASSQLNIEQRISPSSQVIAQWVALQLPQKILIRGTKASFTHLVQECCRERSTVWSVTPLLQDLKRQGFIEIEDEHVRLISQVGSKQADVAVTHFASAVADHICACLGNLEASNKPQFLEQSIQADGLHLASVKLMSQAAHDWWSKALQSITAQAIDLSHQDESAGGDQRVRIGVYFYTQPMSVQIDPATHIQEINE